VGGGSNCRRHDPSPPRARPLAAAPPAGVVGLSAAFAAGSKCGAGASVKISTRPGTATPWLVESATPGPGGAIVAGAAVRLSAVAGPGCRLYVTGPARSCAAACTSGNKKACEGDGDSSLEPLLEGSAAARQLWYLTAQPGGKRFSLASKVGGRRWQHRAVRGSEPSRCQHPSQLAGTLSRTPRRRA